MGIPIREGRNFSDSDKKHPNGHFIFNRTAQLQRNVSVGDRISDIEVIGIAENVHYQPLQYAVSPLVYYVSGNMKLTHMFVKVRTTDIPEISAFIRETVRSFDPDADADIRFLDEISAPSIRRRTDSPRCSRCSACCRSASRSSAFSG